MIIRLNAGAKQTPYHKPRTVKDALFALPTGLEETQERMLLRFNHSLHTDALTLLQWLVYAKNILAFVDSLMVQ